MHIELTDQPIDVAAALEAVQADGAGAVNTFIGTVRNQSTGRRVVRLEYEAYDSMALHQLRKVAEQAVRNGLCSRK
jgi:molybdopterin synthase catalytic subunit